MSKDKVPPDDFDGITLTDCKADNCGTGFQFGKGTKVRGKGLEATNCDNGIVTEHESPKKNLTLENAIKKPLGGKIKSAPNKSFFMNHLAAFVVGFLLLIIGIFFLQPFQQELQDNKQQKEQVKPPK